MWSEAVGFKKRYFMLSLFKKSPRKKLEKAINKKREEAVALQRNGNLRGFAEITAEIEKLEDELDQLEGTPQR
tara:strand:+ start:171 stop:389 length:219 start_codon:yes stop_codon:yes gene_type:complete